jgi:hypothetical protein
MSMDTLRLPVSGLFARLRLREITADRPAVRPLGHRASGAGGGGGAGTQPAAMGILPFTGLPVIFTTAIGFGLILIGFMLRRREQRA